MNKYIYDINTQQGVIVPKTEEEINQENERELLESLKPSQEEIDNAEFEIKTINLLMEMGVI
jgi:hypothetical protein